MYISHGFRGYRSVATRVSFQYLLSKKLRSLCRCCTESSHCVGGGSLSFRRFFTPLSLTLSDTKGFGSRKPQLTKRVAPAAASCVSTLRVFVNNATIRPENHPQGARTQLDHYIRTIGIPCTK
jgi:hypothetical protein